MRKYFTSAVIVLLASHQAARADEWWTFVQITCLPELQQFSARTYGQYNPPNPNSPELEKKYIYSAESLSKRPFRCELPQIDNSGKPTTVEVQAEYSPPGNGYCQGSGTQVIKVVANGVVIRQVDMAYCEAALNTITSVQGNGVKYEALSCLTTFGGFPAIADGSETTECTSPEIK